VRGPREHGRGLIGVPAFAPRRDRHVKTLSVPCPICEAPAGKPCVNLTTGERALNSHQRRRVFALRAEREAKDGEA
jgi:hypothetical protein